jgi:hypothetical protein
MNNFDFICVSGYGKSGSGACIDLLKEFECIDGPNKEFRIIKDPHGLLDLEMSIINNWEFVGHNTAINEFLEYCNMLSRKDGITKRVGKNFSDLLYVDFLEESKRYIDRINNFMYIGDTMLHRYNLNAFQSFKQRIKSKFGLNNSVPMYFSYPSEDKFIAETKLYLSKLFENYATKKKISKIVLDQSIPPANINKTLKYFDNAKLIIVDRDPRDIYTTMINEKRLLGSEPINNNSANKYIAWHHAVRKQSTEDINSCLMQDKVLRLNFEDFFINYEKTIIDIKDFLNIDFNHNDKGAKFHPESVNEHVGIWKGTHEKDIMDRIKNELSEYCFFDKF